MKTVVFALPTNDTLAAKLANQLNAKVGEACFRRFPDQESYVRFDTPVDGRRVILVCTLDRPDDKFLPLLFAVGGARDLGAIEVGLVAPYLGYMRQDRLFQPGEAVTSTYFAKVLSHWIDWLVTVDPHLHRRASLSEIYSVRAISMHAAPKISAWIHDSVSNPLLIGPDSESEQWVAAVAKDADAPFVILEKTRRADREVEVSAPDVEAWRDRTPVLLDDIISTGRTMIETIRRLKAAEMPPPTCIGVHAVFADNAYEDLKRAGAGHIITCNTIAHESNGIDVAMLIANGVESMMV